MTKEVVVLLGSPRKNGNTNILCDEFIKGAKETGANIKKIFIQEKNINYCVGCSECYIKKEKYCQVFDDDMKEILDDIDNADVIVFASPVYFYTITGQMKTVIDRMTPRYQQFTDKECYFIIPGITAEKENLKRAVEDFRGFLDCMPDPEEKGMVLATGVWEEGAVEGTEFMKEAYELGKTI